MLRCN